MTTPLFHRPHTIERRTAVHKTGLLSALLLAAAVHAPDALAQGTQFALTCIGTETGDTVNFQYRWGPDGEWRTTRVQPGKWQAISYRYRYEGENRAPQLEVRFDDDMTSDVNMVRQKLSSYAARTSHCESEGFTYNFFNRRGELFLMTDEGRRSGSSQL